MEIDWNSYLKVHYPALATVYLNQSAQRKINVQLEERNKQIQKSHSNYSSNFYDQFVRVINMDIGSEKEQNVAKSLLSQIDDVVRQLIQICGKNDIPISKLKEQTKGLFQVNGDKYLDKVGEVLSTHYLLTNNPQYGLLDLEFKHEPQKGKNSRDSDLKIHDASVNIDILIDILNVNLDYTKIEDEEKLTKILNHRIGKKHEKKGYNEVITIDSYGKACIQPFIWIYDLDTIQKYLKVLESFSVYNSLPILLLRQRSDDKGSKFYDCVEVKDILT